MDELVSHLPWESLSCFVASHWQSPPRWSQIMKRCASAFSVSLMLVGWCGIRAARCGWRHEGVVPVYYPATRVDLDLLPHQSSSKKGILTESLLVIDLPIAVVTATVFLPLDSLLHTHCGRCRPDRPPPWNHESAEWDELHELPAPPCSASSSSSS